MALSEIEVNAIPSNANLEHEYWKELVAERYRKKGYKVEKEVPIGEGKAADLAARKENERIAIEIEIETGKSDANRNIKKDLETRFDRVTSITVSKGVKNKIGREIKQIGLDQKRKNKGS